MQVLADEESDGTLRVTATVADDDHRFEVTRDGDTAVISYDETLSWRGQIQVSEPEDDVYREVMVSDEVTDFLDRNSLEQIRREKR